MGEKIKVLQIAGGFRKGVSGGIASVLYNYSTVMDHNRFCIDYLALGYQTFEPYREALESYGSRMYCTGIHSTGLRRFCQIMLRIRRFLKEHPDYDIVHINSGSMTQILMTALAVRTTGSKRIVCHAHNALKLSCLRRSFYRVIRPLFYVCADGYLACARQAAESVFPASVIRRNQWFFLPNAIQSERFVYDKKVRQKYRADLGIHDRLVIGHVGRINAQKNHIFLIDIFAYTVQKRDNVVLLLVGTGDLQDKIHEKIEALGLSDRVIFTGQREDVYGLMQAMDVFVFPSLFEGLGMVLIEAQAAGLPVVSADTVPIEETKITDLISYLPLGHAEVWADMALEKCGFEERRNMYGEIIRSGYDLKEAAVKLEKYYENLMP